jgi:CRP-like cAMP-binding protein
VKKSGTVDFKTWYREAHGENTPWGDEESDAFVTNAESALERQISRELMTSGIDMTRRALEPGDTLVQQGEHGDDLFLLVDGVLAVVVDGDEVGEIGPGAIVGELASLEDGRRTATLIARTACRVAVIPAELVDLQEKEDLAVGRR